MQFNDKFVHKYFRTLWNHILKPDRDIETLKINLIPFLKDHTTTWEKVQPRSLCMLNEKDPDLMVVRAAGLRGGTKRTADEMEKLRDD